MIISPTVSIIIPVFNRPDLLKETIKSVQGQKYADWECLLVDDGSEAETIAFIESACAGDNRYHLIKRNRLPKGAPTCRNIGKEAAKGTYVLFLDSDDLLAPWCLEARVAEMEANADADVGLFQGLSFHHQPLDGRHYASKIQEGVAGEDLLAMYLQREINWHTTAPLWRNTFVQNIAWDEAATHWQDREFHITALLQEPRIFISRALPDYFKRSGEGNNVSSRINELDHLENRVAVYNRIYGELPASHREIFKRHVKDERKRWIADHSTVGSSGNRKILEVLQPLETLFEAPSPTLKILGRMLGWLGDIRVPYMRGLLIRLWLGSEKHDRKRTSVCPTPKLVSMQNKFQGK